MWCSHHITWYEPPQVRTKLTRDTRISTQWYTFRAAHEHKITPKQAQTVCAVCVSDTPPQPTRQRYYLWYQKIESAWGASRKLCSKTSPKQNTYTSCSGRSLFQVTVSCAPLLQPSPVLSAALQRHCCCLVARMSCQGQHQGPA
jgi:hypothetical protein